MKQFSILFIIAGLMMLPYISIAAGPPGPPPGGGPPCWPPPCGIPIDGGITFLAAAGVLYAGKKLFRKNSLKNSD